MLSCLLSLFGYCQIVGVLLQLSQEACEEEVTQETFQASIHQDEEVKPKVRE